MPLGAEHACVSCHYRDVRSAVGSDVQAQGVALLVDKFDAGYAPSASRGAPYLMHQLEQHRYIDLRRRAQPRYDAQMQHHETVSGQAYEYGNAEWSTVVRHCKERLHTFDIPNADAQSAILLVDLRYAVSFDGLLNPYAHPMLIDVEEEQLLQGSALF